MPKLMLIDGNSLVNRAYYGVRPLSAPDGTPTNAIFGFGGNHIKILLFQVDILFLQIEKFRDAAGIVIQHQNDLAVRISLVRPKSCQLVFAEDVTVALVGVLVTVACQINIL